MMVKKKDFTGRLAEPIKFEGSSHGKTRAGVEMFEKLMLLREHYDVEPGVGGADCFMVAWKLALEFVPGFQFEHVGLRTGRGRKKDSPATLLRLIMDVCTLIDERGLSVSSAARVLAKRKGGQWHKQASGTLRNKFNRAAKDERVWDMLRHMNQKRGSTEIE